ncbi:hypothetical protein IC757_03225 [Wenzhouxiangella sp. AB-CW3]|uniref:hypothetical protein n=1 Tax=Wenzhouxiangella sp. AB-CW3 TaxID=2771012 RepID=UPI00168B5E7C|nr:hypothetical protein [Wenzhouxiangella sp. AB-CW3]QOC23183.1 hypothetical protein IC757_03225 [Wenzhouxiangella sp. AB-CW3]
MIARYESRSQADERAAFLRSRGIASHVTDLTSMRLNLAHQGQFRAALWVVLPEQAEDALALLEDPDHRADTALDEREFERLENEGADAARRTMMRWLILTALGLAGLAALVVAIGQ